MKFYSRIFVLCLCLIMVLLSLPMMSNAAPNDEMINLDYAQSDCNFLKALDIFDEDENSLDTQKQVSRAHFIKMCIKLSGYDPELLSDNENCFADVTSSVKYKSYIDAAYRLGYISGSDSGLFNPDDIITLQQATKILCVILGYDNYANAYGGYPAGYLWVAQRLKLFDGLNAVDESGVLTLGDVAVLLRNAAETEIMQAVSYGEDVKVETRDGETLLYKQHGVQCSRGIVSANSYTDLLSVDSGLEKEQVIVGASVFNSGSSKVKNHIGYDVLIYYDASEEKKVKDIYYSELTDNNKVYTASPGNVDVNDDIVTIYSNNNETEKIRVSSNASFLVNGKLSSMVINDIVDVEKGDLVFISNDNNNVIDVVSITKYDTFYVKGVSPTENLLVFNDGSELELDYDSNDYTFEILKNNTPIGLSDIKVDDVVLVSGGTGNGLYHVSLLVNTKKLSSVIEEIGSDYVIVESQKYTVDKSVAGQLSVGKRYNILLDAFNNISFIQRDNDIVYGYLYQIGKEGPMSNPKCRIFTENDRWVTLEFADKVRFNGTSYSASTLYNTLSENVNSYRQLIRYNVNDIPRIVSMETAKEYTLGTDSEKDATSTDEFRKLYQGSLMYYSSVKSLGSKFFVDGKTKIFNIPADMSEKNFKIKTIASLVNDRTYDVTAYDIDKYLNCGVLTTDGLVVDKNISSSDRFMVIKSVGKMVNSEGDACPSIRGYWNSLEISFPVLVGDDGVDQEVIDNLSSGDVILFKQDAEDNIINITEYNAYSTYYVTRTNLYYSFNVIGGIVDEIDYENKRVRLIYTANGELAPITYSSSTTVAIWDNQTKEYKVAGVSDILPEDKIFANMNYLRCNDILIIR